MKKTIYVVTSGDYSDYGINAIFSSEELALGYIHDTLEEGNEYGAKYRIEKYVLDDEKSTPYDREPYTALIFQDNTGEVTKGAIEGTKEARFDNYNGQVSLTHTIYARNEQHAKKIGSEKRAQIIALKGWPSISDIQTYEAIAGQLLLTDWMGQTNG